MTERKKLLEWNTLDIAQGEAEYFAEIMGVFPSLDEDELFNKALEDTDLFTQEWDFLCDHLTELMEKCNPDGCWYIEAVNFGWRNLRGHQRCQALTGEKLLERVLPKTDCTFTIYDDAGGGFAIQNFHHDSPTGEWYYVYPDSGEEAE